METVVSEAKTEPTGITEILNVEERIAQRRSTLPSLDLPEASGGIPFSKNSSFVEANVVADPNVWNHRFTGTFTTPVANVAAEEKSLTSTSLKPDRPPTPEVSCCSLFFS
ncbi:uncharacterized protein TM35_000441180 [Trypanosoma theileri]|uniref:Uncharacterized protein n=1 Tax=Trypanosoma theileri TaxID=67003 RepID=A0A1X0NI83_9TRYP|nr:uncharacterized protein TM35_000441180 [Trypanosoma theileri]ORC84462.1 hypothetical protein TM35_000441180 [Trypanosoma theileri]